MVAAVVAAWKAEAVATVAPKAMVAVREAHSAVDWAATEVALADCLVGGMVGGTGAGTAAAVEGARQQLA